MSKSELYNTLYDYLRTTNTKTGKFIRKVEVMQQQALDSQRLNQW